MRLGSICGMFWGKSRMERPADARGAGEFAGPWTARAGRRRGAALPRSRRPATNRGLLG